MAVIDPRRILILRTSHLGDVAHAVALLHALHAAYPRAEIRWVIQPEFAALIEPLPGLAGTIPFERRRGARAWLRLARDLEAFGADWTIDAQGNLKSALISWLSGARRRVALHPQDWQEPWAAGSAGEHVARAGGTHALDRVGALVRHLVPGVARPLRTDPALSDAERAEGRTLLEATLAGPAPLLVHLSPPGDSRGWPAASWLELLRGPELADRPVLVLSGPAEADLGRELEIALPAGPRRAHLVAQRGVRQLCALFAAAAARGGRLVACDSGPMHLAWSSGLPVDLLAGPQDARRTGPWPPGPSGAHRVHRAASAPECAPCLRRRCHHPRGPVCMSGLSAAQVLAGLARAAAH